MASVALSAPLEWHVELGSVTRLRAGGGDGTGSLRVYLRDKAGGPRLAEIPPHVWSDVEWEETRGQAPTASLSISRTAMDDDLGVYWVQRLQQWTREIEIVWEGETVFWGPISNIPEAWGQPFTRVTCVGAEWYFGRRKMLGSEVFWSRNFVVNPQFDQGFSHWTNEAGGASDRGTLDSAVKETGMQSVRLAPGESLQQRVKWNIPDASFSPRVRVRLRADAGITDATLRFERSDFVQAISQSAQIGPLTPRDQWVWLTVDSRFVATHLPIQSYITITDIAGSGDVWVDRVEAIIDPRSFRLRAPDALRPYMTKSVAAATIVDRVNSELSLNIGVLTDPLTDGERIAQPWEPGMFCSQALRALSDLEDGLEYRWSYASDTRILEAKALVGEEHAPEDVDLRVAGVAANVRGGSATGGVDQPVSRMIARDEDGFTDQAEDLGKYDGLILEDQVQAPMGVRDLASLANARLAASNDDTRAWTLEVSDRALISRVRLLDRVPMEVDDGPDQFSGLVRVERRRCRPGAAVPLELTVSRWVDPGLLPKVPRAAKPIVPPGIDDQVIDLSRRTYDLEQRVAGVGGVETLAELLDVDVSDDYAPFDGDVLTYDEGLRLWVPGVGGGGGGGGGGSLPMMYVIGEAGDFAYEDVVYDFWDGDIGLVPTMGGGGAQVASIAPTEPGLWHFVANVIDGAGTVRIISSSNAGGWRFDEFDSVPCRPFPSTRDELSVSVDMPCVRRTGSTDCTGAAIVVTGDVVWTLQAHRLHYTEMIEGNCGD